MTFKMSNVCDCSFFISYFKNTFSLCSSNQWIKAAVRVTVTMLLLTAQWQLCGYFQVQTNDFSLRYHDMTPSHILSCDVCHVHM